MNAYSHFCHVLLPKSDRPKFIKTDEIISPNQLSKRFPGTDPKGLVSVQILAALNIHLGGDIELSRKTMTEFLQNMSMQALNREDDNNLLHSGNITDLVTNIIAVLRQQSKKSQQINDVNKTKVDRQLIATISSPST